MNINELPPGLKVTGGAITIVPSSSSSKHDFDFLFGGWTVHNRKLKSRLTGCQEWSEFEFTTSTRSILDGFGNVDESGSTMRLFNSETGIWTIYSGFPGAEYLDLMQGTFDEGVGSFYGPDSHDGRPAICQFKWDASNPNEPIWSQAQSIDEGVTWEWNWYMHFVR